MNWLPQRLRCEIGRHDFQLTYSEFNQKHDTRYVEFTCSCCGKVETRETDGIPGSGCLYYYVLVPKDRICRRIDHPTNELTWGTKHKKDEGNG